MEQDTLPEREYMVLIRCYTYNHEKYIEDALKGFVMQKTNFPFVAVVIDDASTDGTVNIIRRYETEYPNIIKGIYLQDNHYSQKKSKTPYIQPWRNKSKYEAICEGDDFWTDSLKLQKQVDFLEMNPDYSFVCHRYNIYEQKSGRYLKEYAYNYYERGKNLEISLELLYKAWATQILATMIRISSYNNIIPLLIRYKYSRDVHMYYHLLKVGKGVSLNCNMGVYRWHNTGTASNLKGYERYKLAYNIYKELYEYNLNDLMIRRIFLKNLNRYLRYIPNLKDKYKLLQEGFNLSNSVKDKFSLVKSFLFPPCIYSKLGIIYRKFYLERLTLKE